MTELSKEKASTPTFFEAFVARFGFGGKSRQVKEEENVDVFSMDTATFVEKFGIIFNLYKIIFRNS